jgi:hypothetical protein
MLFIPVENFSRCQNLCFVFTDSESCDFESVTFQRLKTAARSARAGRLSSELHR